MMKMGAYLGFILDQQDFFDTRAGEVNQWPQTGEKKQPFQIAFLAENILLLTESTAAVCLPVALVSLMLPLLILTGYSLWLH